MSAAHLKLEAAALVLNGLLVQFMSVAQRTALIHTLRGEEGEAIADLVFKARDTILNMPHTYQQDGLGDKAVVHLHYFKGCYDAWITEKDRGNTAVDTRQIQAFGKASFSGIEDAELGYISIEEVLSSGAELDLYWTPKTLGELT